MENAVAGASAPTGLGIQSHIVLMVCGRWWVDIEGKGFGPCVDQADACHMAINLAQTFGDDARRREVVLMRPDGGHSKIWASWLPPASATYPMAA